jgi:hypothetical protein
MSLKGRTVADGSGFSDFPVSATMVDPSVMATRKTKNKRTGVKRSRSRNPGADPGAIRARSTRHKQDSTCWKGCRDSDCTDRYPHEACYDSEDERAVNEQVDKK